MCYWFGILWQRMNKIRLFVVVLGVGLLHAATGLAQSPGKEVTHQQLVWFSYSVALTFNNRWSLITEVQERRFINPDRHHQFLARTQARYALGRNWEAELGFTYFLQSPNDPKATERLAVPELRPHIQLSYAQPLGRVSISHRYRAEKRFFRNTSNGELAPGYNTNYRFRYKLGVAYRLTYLNDRPLKLEVSDEIHLNTGDKILYNRFDQNRIYAGLSYAVSEKLEVSVGYLNWYQQRDAGNQFYNRHIVQLAISHNIDLSGKRREVLE